MQYPSQLKYTKDHEWAQIEGNQVTVGITDHAQRALGDVVYLELPNKDRILKKGETFGVVESIKAVSDLYAPISGKVIAVNSDLADHPAIINNDPHAGAWMIKLEISDPSTLSDLMDAQTYSHYVETLK